MPNGQLMTVHVHELLSYMSSRGVTTIMTLVQRGVFGAPIDEAAEVSYLADSVILLRYFEHAGAVRQSISVVKHRTGPHERTIRECRIERGGMRVGEPLGAFRGVLTGVPVYSGEGAPPSCRCPPPLTRGRIPQAGARGAWVVGARGEHGPRHAAGGLPRSGARARGPAAARDGECGAAIGIDAASGAREPVNVVPVVRVGTSAIPRLRSE